MSPMKRLLLGLSLVIGIWMLSPTPEADARGRHRHGSYDGGRTGHAVPELDPGVAGSAMVLLLGGVALIASRRRDEDLA
jgi:hypothetical protein